MTAWIHALPLAVPGHPLHHTGQAPPVQPALPNADAFARRLSGEVGRGDEAAFQELYDRYHQRLFRFALTLGQGHELIAGEIVQSVFLTAAARLRRVESDAHLWNWLARVARQQFAKICRKRRQDYSVVGMAELPDCADSRESDPVLEERLDAALVTMEPEERQVIEWFYFERRSHKEIAQQLGVTPKAVSSRLERARARLRSLLTRNFSHET